MIEAFLTRQCSIDVFPEERQSEGSKCACKIIRCVRVACKRYVGFVIRRNLYIHTDICSISKTRFLSTSSSTHVNASQNDIMAVFIRVRNLGYPVPPCSIKSTPFRMTPTSPPVWTTSPPPPLNLYSTSARPSNHDTLVCGGTSNFANSSPRAVRISAKASPLFAFR